MLLGGMKVDLQNFLFFFKFKVLLKILGQINVIHYVWVIFQHRSEQNKPILL